MADSPVGSPWLSSDGLHYHPPSLHIERHIMSDLFSVAGKVALITGSTSGIGLMIARGLVERGARCYIVARNAKACNEVAAELRAFGQCEALPGDLSTKAGVDAVAAALESREGALDILVNNAGGMYDAPIEEFTEEGWDSIADL